MQQAARLISNGQLAQLVARFLDMEEATGSNPVLSKFFIPAELNAA